MRFQHRHAIVFMLLPIFMYLFNPDGNNFYVAARFITFVIGVILLLTDLSDNSD